MKLSLVLNHIIHMRTNISWKVFFALLFLTVFGALMISPYYYYLFINSPPQGAITPLTLIFNQVTHTIAGMTPVILVGLVLAKRLGFSLPFLQGFLERKKIENNFIKVLVISIIIGGVVALLLLAIDLVFSKFSGHIEIPSALIPPLLERVFAAFYGGINEEVLYRLFAMSFIVWITFKIKSTKNKKPTIQGIWIGIIISSLVFAFLHLSSSLEFVKTTPLIIVRSMIINGLGGIFYGLLFWKEGLESAMIAHLTTDFILQILP